MKKILILAFVLIACKSNAQTSPSCTVITPGNGSLVAADGGVWTITSAGTALRNGADVASYNDDSLTCRNGCSDIYVHFPGPGGGVGYYKYLNPSWAFSTLPACDLVVNVVDPATISFTPSPDHNTLNSDGTPALTSYGVSVLSGTTIIANGNLGKPNPVNNSIDTPIPATVKAALQNGVSYTLTVLSIGAAGFTTSLPSNVFSFDNISLPNIVPAAPSNVFVH